MFEFTSSVDIETLHTFDVSTLKQDTELEKTRCLTAKPYQDSVWKRQI